MMLVVLFIQYAVAFTVLDSVHRKCIVGLGILFSQYCHCFITVFISLSFLSPDEVRVLRSILFPHSGTNQREAPELVDHCESNISFNNVLKIFLKNNFTV